MEGAIKQSRQERPLGEAGLSEERDGSRHPEGMLGGGQSEKGHQAVWNPEKGEGNPLSLICSSIASEPFSPRQAVMRPLGPRDHRRRGRTNSGKGWLHLEVQVLAVQKDT